MNYNKYKLNEFLNDIDFVLWCMDPDKDTGSVWNTYAESYPENAAEFNRAVSVMKNVRLNEYSLPAEEKLSLFNDIADDYREHKHRRSRKLHLLALSVAAAVAVIATPVYMALRHGGRETVTLVSANDIRLTNQGETKVIASEMAKIEYSEKGEVHINGQPQQQPPPAKAKKAAVSMNELVVPSGKRAFVTLADGTNVWVNSGTTLRFPSSFDGDERNIYVNGEIYLDVARNDRQLFTVNCPDFSTRVLGTGFCISSYESPGLPGHVVLVEGSVAVTMGNGETVRLNPSEMISIKGNSYSVREVDVYQYISWKDGLLTFSGETLNDILSQISRYYNIDIKCSPSVGGMSCTGKLVLFEDLGKTLDVITEILPVRYVITDNEVTIYMN